MVNSRDMAGNTEEEEEEEEERGRESGERERERTMWLLVLCVTWFKDTDTCYSTRLSYLSGTVSKYVSHVGLTAIAY